MKAIELNKRHINNKKQTQFQYGYKIRRDEPSESCQDCRFWSLS